jgi:chaperonin GroEL (HSP60 family)
MAKNLHLIMNMNMNMNTYTDKDNLNRHHTKTSSVENVKILILQTKLSSVKMIVENKILNTDAIYKFTHLPFRSRDCATVLKISLK